MPEKLLVANSPELETLSELENPKLNDTKSTNTALVKVVGLDLRRRDLRHAELSDIKLYKADLRQAKVQGVRLFGGRLQNAKLEGAQLQNAKLEGAQLQGATLRSAQLQGASLLSALLQGANLNIAHLQGANLKNAQLQGAELRSARMQGANLYNAQLQGTHLNSAQLQGAHLNNALLLGANLHWAQLQGANFNSAYLGSASLIRAKTGFNNFLNADFNKPISQAYYEAIAKLLGEDQKEYLIALRQRIGKATELPQPGFEPPCLGDANSTAVKNCGKAEEYFPKLAEFLGNLACIPGNAEAQRFIAAGIAIRVTLEDQFNNYESEWKNGGESARQQLAKRLLSDDCAGKEGIDDNKREELKKIAEPPKPTPGEP